jgi:hypothetical protein
MSDSRWERPEGAYSPIEQPTLVLTCLWLIDPESGRRSAFVCCCREDDERPPGRGDYVSFFVSEAELSTRDDGFECPQCDPGDKHRVVGRREALELGLFNTTPNSDRDGFSDPMFSRCGTR